MDNMREIIFVMSNDSWEWIKEKEYEFANTQPDPIQYLKEVSSLNVVIDNGLPFGIVETWDKENYDKYIQDLNDE